ncbi:MAG: hypothetical protein M1812_000306 [Candelaria pacifica]|nr:MAG: hypothetical protein M1812_000306 [Candelaria pacifica]
MATSPKANTPTAVPSPLSLAPAPPTNSSPHAVPDTRLASPYGFQGLPLVTRKEWVLPPRPKPGRKPATDTPPTKRKAQNRAAQRAFRERRASKVGELEEHIRHIEEEDEREQTGLREHITRLEADVENYRAELEAWGNRAQALERELTNERAQKEQLRVEARNLSQSDHETTDAVSPPLGKPPSQEEPSRPQKLSGQGSTINLLGEEGGVIGCGNCTPETRCECMEQALKEEPMGCGKCSVDTNCKCIEQAFGTSEIAWSRDLPAPTSKRPHSPTKVVNNKRHQDRRAKIEAEELEIDFTAMYASNKARNRFNVMDSPERASPAMDRDPCGFCSDGSHCLCAELELEATNDISEQTQLPPIRSHITPPPSDGDVQCSNNKIEPLHPNMSRSLPLSNPCANGPGTCAQCQKDPQSTLFCKSVAAMRGPTSNPSDACCGSPGVTGGCCRSQASAQTSNPPPLNKPLLSCADAYTTLSRHPRYSEASEELGTWLGRLNTTPPRTGAVGRPAMEIEAASVMGVLKLFDRRFGSG